MSKPSPSKVNPLPESPHHKDDDDEQEEEEVDDLHAHLNMDMKGLLAELTNVSSNDLSYANTRSSSLYDTAKTLLNQDAFESALSLIETGLSSLASMGCDDLHPALGPLYYLYGTTLLYSVEESQVDDANVMMNPNHGSEEGDQEEDQAGDLQIAWENLETARRIITTLLNEEQEQQDGEYKKDLTLDLAQIHTRLADLSRHEGHYKNSLDDLHQAKSLREKVLTDEQKWDRRIADVEYNLAMTALLLASEGEKNLVDQQEQQQHQEEVENVSSKNKDPMMAMMNAMMGGNNTHAENQGSESKVVLTMDEISALREKAICHYVQCARIFAGIIGTCCNVDPNALAEADESLEYHEDSKVAAAATTTTDVTENASTMRGEAMSSIQVRASKALEAIRTRVANALEKESVKEEDSERVHDMKELLDEIQETIDNCEQDREGLRDVAMMKKQAEEEIRKSDDAEGFTTIGFGSSSESKVSVAATATSTTTIGFGETATSIPTMAPAAAPMMVVKKKKKLDLKSTDDDDAENETNKRAKTIE